MLRRLNRKGQSTGEYALVFALILGAVVVMQTYVKRALQGRIKAGSDYMATETSTMGTDGLYEPDYSRSEYVTDSTSQQGITFTAGGAFEKIVGTGEGDPGESSTRETDGYSEELYTAPEE